MGIRRALYVLMLLGLAGSISTQASQVPQLTMDKAKGLPDATARKALLDNLLLSARRPFKATFLDLKGKNIFFRYGRSASEGAVIRLSGGVAFTLDGTQVSASEADVDMRAGTISLRGDVSLKIR
jgi:hypothetical protein